MQTWPTTLRSSKSTAMEEIAQARETHNVAPGFGGIPAARLFDRARQLRPVGGERHCRRVGNRLGLANAPGPGFFGCAFRHADKGAELGAPRGCFLAQEIRRLLVVLPVRFLQRPELSTLSKVMVT